jgi:Cys-tRNA(Pro)/Cys-tRNA(Cys) deacylase
MAKAPRTEKTNVMRLLDQAGVAYSAHFYDTEDGLIDGKSVAQKTGHPCEQTFKTLLAQGPAGDLFVFVLPVDRELDLKKAAQAAAQKSIVMAPARDLLKHTGYIHGGCSPIGMKKPFPTWIHETALRQETVFVSAGKVGFQIELAPADLLRASGCRPADLV